MPYIGKNPVGGGFHKLDALTASATDTYALTLNSAAYYPESANQLLVSLNGVIQAPQDSFTVSGSNLVFDTALTASDSIDFVVALGDVLAVQTVTDGAITTAKLGNGAVTTAKLASTIAPTNLQTTSSTFKMTDLTSNAFYRTGTFTPAFSSQSATDQDASIASAYDAQVGHYTRIGDLVHIEATIITDSVSWVFTNGGATGQNLTIVGLPFTVKNVTNYYPSISVGSFANWTGWSTGFTPLGYGVTNTKRINMVYAVGNGVTDILTTYIPVLESNIVFSMTYETDDA